MHTTRGWFSMFRDIIFDSSNIFWIEASSISPNNINEFIGKFKIKIGVLIFRIKANGTMLPKTGSINVCSHVCVCDCACVYVWSLWRKYIYQAYGCSCIHAKCHRHYNLKRNTLKFTHIAAHQTNQNAIKI